MLAHSFKIVVRPAEALLMSGKSQWSNIVLRNWRKLRNAPVECRADRGLIYRVVRKNGLALKFATDALRRERVVVLRAVKTSGSALEWASPMLREDRDLVLEAVKQDGAALEFAAPCLRKDPKVVSSAVTQNGLALCYADPALRSDREVVISAVSQNGIALAYATEDLRADKEIAMLAVRQHWEALKWAPAESRADPSVILEGVQQDGGALGFASSDLRRDRELVLQAIRFNGCALKWAAQVLREDTDLVREAVVQDTAALQFAPDHVRANKAFVLEAVSKDWRAIEHASEELLMDDSLWLLIIRNHADGWQALQFAPPLILSDNGIVLLAVQQDWHAINYVEHIDFSVMVEALKQDWHAVDVFVSKELAYCQEPDKVLEASLISTLLVKANPFAIQHPSVRNNRTAALTAVKQIGSLLEHLSDNLKADLEIVVAAGQQDPLAISFASPTVRKHPALQTIARDSQESCMKPQGHPVTQPLSGADHGSIRHKKNRTRRTATKKKQRLHVKTVRKSDVSDNAQHVSGAVASRCLRAATPVVGQADSAVLPRITASTVDKIGSALPPKLQGSVVNLPPVLAPALEKPWRPSISKASLRAVASLPNLRSAPTSPSRVPKNTDAAALKRHCSSSCIPTTRQRNVQQTKTASRLLQASLPRIERTVQRRGNANK